MGLIEKLRVTQRAMERAVLGASLGDKEIRNEEIRRRNRLIDVLRRVAMLKLQWAGHNSKSRWPLVPKCWNAPPRGRRMTSS
ncbi:jg9866 [Pararge aegeria aegeria]|uniref:Jg9866 protein n=1 Tax=Pararge aegeria aegeria TaxID=348720 RepID=A0A8S4REV3_9NEOP|nr:jg9866 [Pararge aegeria aegeria]